MRNGGIPPHIHGAVHSALKLAGYGGEMDSS